MPTIQVFVIDIKNNIRYIIHVLSEIVLKLYIILSLYDIMYQYINIEKTLY